MVTTPVNPNSVPIITLSGAELDEMRESIEAGLLPEDWIDRHYAAVEMNVFGQDFKRDKHGNPIEMGRGSAGNQTAQSVEAFKKWGRNEPDYEKTLARMTRELEASNERRKAEAAATPRGTRR